MMARVWYSKYIEHGQNIFELADGIGINSSKIVWTRPKLFDPCFVHPIFSPFGFGYFGHFSCMIFFRFFFRLAHLALQNVNKDNIIFT